MSLHHGWRYGFNQQRALSALLALGTLNLLVDTLQQHEYLLPFTIVLVLSSTQQLLVLPPLLKQHFSER